MIPLYRIVSALRGAETPSLRTTSRGILRAHQLRHYFAEDRR